jgi:DNA-binding MarR family transcriptional regulator
MAKQVDIRAHELMETTKKIIQNIGCEMRRGHSANLSVPQVTSSRFIQSNPDGSLPALANHLGLTLPSVSKLVDGLVKKELINRHESSKDRQRLTIVLTQSGESIVNSARASAQVNIAKILSNLSNEVLNMINKALELLNPSFTLQKQKTLKV